MKKRIAALALLCCMMLACFPANALAADGGYSISSIGYETNMILVTLTAPGASRLVVSAHTTDGRMVAARAASISASAAPQTIRVPAPVEESGTYVFKAYLLDAGTFVPLCASKQDRKALTLTEYRLVRVRIAEEWNDLYYSDNRANLPVEVNGAVLLNDARDFAQTFEPQDYSVAQRGGGDALLYSYDAAGNLTNIAQYYRYDVLGTATQVANDAYTYDGAGKVTSVQHDVWLPLGYREERSLLTKYTTTATYTYDGRGNPTAVTSAGGDATWGANYKYQDTLQYDADNRAVSLSRRYTESGGIINVSVAYGANGLPAQETVNRFGGSNLTKTFYYDANGNLTKTVMNDSYETTTTYTYDAFGHQLTARDGTFASECTYDANGNLATFRRWYADNPSNAVVFYFDYEIVP